MAAAQLPRIGIRRPPTVVGRSTVPAMQSGVFWGYVGLIEGLIQRIRAERGNGGDRDRRLGASTAGRQVISRVDPDLTLW